MANDFLDEDMGGFFGSPAPQAVQQNSFQQQSSQTVPQNSFQQQNSQTIQVSQKNGNLSTSSMIANPFANVSIDLGINGVSVEDTGVVISRFPIDKLKITDVKPERFAILIDKVMVVPYHFIDGVGSVICNGGKCCSYSKKRNIRYVYYIVHYTDTGARGNITGNGVDLKCLSLAEAQYLQLTQVASLKGALSQFDFVASAKSKGKEGFLDITMTEAGQVTWLKSQEAVSFISEKFRQDGKYVLDSIARTLTDDELDEAVKSAMERGNEVSLSGLR